MRERHASEQIPFTMLYSLGCGCDLIDDPERHGADALLGAEEAVVWAQ
jgi:hypothetical protein